MKKITTLLFLTMLLLWVKVYLRRIISETKTHHAIQDEESETGSYRSIFDDNTPIYHAIPDSTIGTKTDNSIFGGKIGTESNRLIVDGKIGTESNRLIVDGKIGTESNRPIVDGKIGTESNRLIVDGNIGTESNRPIVDGKIGTESNRLIVDGNIGTESNRPIVDGKIGTESNRLIVDDNIGRGTNHPTPDDENKKETYHNTPFEPDVLEDFPMLETENPIIPHIIHFIFITGVAGKGGIPAKYVENVNSFAVLNPDWTIYFWSDVSARMLISTKFPSFLSTWDNYRLVIHKADALRYVVLYELGGVYSDLDVLCVRPLDRATMKYACIISPEPFEQSTIFARKPLQLNNGFLLCREKHPFMKQAISYLPQSAHNRYILEVAGPKFITSQYMIYNNLTWDDLLRNKTDLDSNSPYFYKGSRAVDDNDAIYIPNTRYFMNTMMKRVFYARECRKSSSWNTLVKRGCKSWKERTKNLSLNKFSYVDHQWFHDYSFQNSTKLIPIYSVVSKTQLKIWGLKESFPNDFIEH